MAVARLGKQSGESLHVHQGNPSKVTGASPRGRRPCCCGSELRAELGERLLVTRELQPVLEGGRRALQELAVETIGLLGEGLKDLDVVLAPAQQFLCFRPSKEDAIDLVGRVADPNGGTGERHTKSAECLATRRPLFEVFTV